MGELIRIGLFVSAVALIGLNHRLGKEILDYFIKPGSKDLKFRIVKLGGTQLPKFILMHFGLAMLVSALVPITDVQSKVELPNNFLETSAFFAFAAFIEEFLFRIVPWILFFGLRKLTKRAKWAEWANVIGALLVTIVFGLMHVTNYTNPDIWTYIGTTSQAFGGLVYWYLVDKEGIAASTLGHMGFNMLVWGLTQLG